MGKGDVNKEIRRIAARSRAGIIRGVAHTPKNQGRQGITQKMILRSVGGRVTDSSPPVGVGGLHRGDFLLSFISVEESRFLFLGPASVSFS